MACENRGRGSILAGVSCTGPIFCAGVGWHGHLDGIGPGTRTLVESPSGTTLSQLTITDTSLPPGTVGQPYSFVLQATGGNPPYTWWYAKGGSLPRGIKLSTAGVLSGTPKKAGSYSITFRVRDTKIAGQPINTATTTLPVTITITIT